MSNKLKKKIIVVSGARPNFMKIAPIMHTLAEEKDFNVLLVHTGQHYDPSLSDTFFRDLSIPSPNIYLNVGSYSHATQTAKVMMQFEQVLMQENPDLVIVVGDINSTMACSLVAVKMRVPLAHVEAGLRSGDRAMPEEINRIVTDAVSDYLFVSEVSGMDHLKNEGIDAKKIFFVGNIMIDTLLSNKIKIDQSNIINRLNLKQKDYCVLTLHRPSNVDKLSSLKETFHVLQELSRKINIIYPVHPRTKRMINEHYMQDDFQSIRNLSLIDPLGYIDFMKLVKESRFVLTDSGGIQEETTVLKVRCLTMRENTERPVTIREGTNQLVGRNAREIMAQVDDILGGKPVNSRIPKYWDGKTAQRIAQVIRQELQ